jgi:hypothetical protein
MYSASSEWSFSVRLQLVRECVIKNSRRYLFSYELLMGGGVYRNFF